MRSSCCLLAVLTVIGFGLFAEVSPEDLVAPALLFTRG